MDTPVGTVRLAAAWSWSIAASIAAGLALVVVTLWRSPDQVWMAHAPFATFVHVVAFGTVLHCAALAAPSLASAWLARRSSPLAHVPRVLGAIVVLVPPALFVWLFAARAGRTDLGTQLGAVALGVVTIGLGWALGRSLARLDRVAARLAPVATLVLAVLLVAVLLPSGSPPAREEPPPPDLSRPTPGTTRTPPRTVLLLTIDTLRADHLGAWGYGRPTSPSLDRLAAEGLQLTDTLAGSSGTVPSFGVIHAGLSPECTGVENQLSVLGPGVMTLAERFRDAGYRTLAVTSNSNLDVLHGFHQGYDQFENLGEVGGAAIVDRAITLWGGIDETAPVFAWVHLFDPHTPYVAPPETWERWRGDELWSDRTLEQIDFGSWGGIQTTRTLGARARGPLTLGEVEARYDGEIALADAAAGRLLRWLDETGRADDAVVAFVADHGETLVRGPDDVQFQHALQVYQDDLHVPFVVWGPGRVVPGRSEVPAHHLDLVPTVLDASGLPADPLLPGRSVLDEPSAPPVRVSRSAWWDALSLKLVPLDGRTPSRVAILSGWKLVVHPHDGLRAIRDPWAWVDAWRSVLVGIWQDDQLYDLSTDPRETRDRSEDSADRVAQLRALLDADISASHPSCALARGSELELNDETREQLRELGYLD